MGAFGLERAWPRWLLALVALGWMGIAAAAGPLFLWEVHDGDGRPRAWLYGTVHVCDAACLPLPGAVGSALAAADSLALELDPQDMNVTRVVVQAGRLAPGERLDAQLPPSLPARLNAVARKVGMPEPVLQTMQPWFVSTVLAVRAAQMSGYATEHGIDLALARLARERRKPLWTLETPERQIAALSAGGPAVQVAYLGEVVAIIEADAAGTYYGAMLAAWRAGDVAALDNLVREEYGGPELVPLLDDLLSRRNHEMADAIVAALQAGRRPFVAVGAGHLGGADGLLQLMTQRGYTLRQVRNESP